MTRHHIFDAPDCPLCDEKLKTAHPLLQQAYDAIKKKFPDCHISWSYRNQMTQDELFKEGRSKLPWPRSAHNKMPSEAIDLFQLNPDNEVSYKKEYFRDIYKFLIKQLFPIEWAGEWTHFREYDHFQIHWIEGNK